MSKIASDRSAKLVQDLALQAGNDICADCKTKSPRWASHNLGIFLCVYCASVHRKIGTHISKVKSITMDSWTKEQAETMKNIGNVKSNAIFCPDEFRHPPPPPLMDATRDNELEQYIRSKYEYKKFMSKSALVASKLGPSRSLRDVSPATRSNTAPPPTVTPASPPRPSTVGVPTPQRSVTQPPPPSISQPTIQQPQQQQQQQPGVWADLVSLQGPSSSSTLPLQIQSPASQQYMQQQSQPTGMGMGMGSAYQPPSTVMMGMNGTSNPMQMNSPGLQQPQGYMFAPQGQQQYGQPQQQFIPQQQFGQQQFGQQQFGQQQGMMSPTPQYQSQMMSPTPQYNLSTTPSGMPGLSTTPGMQGMQGMSTTPSFHMTPSPNMFAGQFGGGQMGMGVSPSPNYGMAMQQTNPFQQQQQQQQQMQLPPMGGGAWPQPMYGQQQQQQQPMMQPGQWMAM
ncbi:ArfGap-domain-containing protein [Cylindrobasidium torrendii FP15055 ss-10]|uniref:ArfGap-domain-containing protein n=1 Tax=Cylindrobasidium torrendii FP15055 ss-10 TaxID=1314674 RepID=A0A0D7AWK3_9AGAR|nr:ArfGap-domain-containing protein [Cylindrobasidium torrendii FP15055 ss-10]